MQTNVAESEKMLADSNLRVQSIKDRLHAIGGTLDPDAERILRLGIAIEQLAELRIERATRRKDSGLLSD